MLLPSSQSIEYPVGGPEPVPIEDEVVANLVRGRVDCDRTSIVVVHNRLPIPAVEHSVIAAFAHKVHNQILLEDLASLGSVVEIHTGTGAVHEYVAFDNVGGRFSLEVRTRLLSVHAHRVDKVGLNEIAFGVKSVARGAVHQPGGPEHRNRRLAHAREAAAHNFRLVDCVGEHDSVAADLVKGQPLQRDVGRVLDKEGGTPVDGPVAPGRALVIVQVRWDCVREGDAGKGEVCRAVDLDDAIEHRPHHRGRLVCQVGRVGGDVPQLPTRRRKPLPGVIELFSDVFDVKIVLANGGAAALLVAPINDVLSVRVALRARPHGAIGELAAAEDQGVRRGAVGHLERPPAPPTGVVHLHDRRRGVGPALGERVGAEPRRGLRVPERVVVLQVEPLGRVVLVRVKILPSGVVTVQGLGDCKRLHGAVHVSSGAQ
eukprot:m.247597 g.247597  ORF g.247597 m.247597 type:complete len:429 (+) comp15863_c0_seq2:5372-6658(+)